MTQLRKMFSPLSTRFKRVCLKLLVRIETSVIEKIPLSKPLGHRFRFLKNSTSETLGYSMNLHIFLMSIMFIKATQCLVYIIYGSHLYFTALHFCWKCYISYLF